MYGINYTCCTRYYYYKKKKKTTIDCNNNSSLTVYSRSGNRDFSGGPRSVPNYRAPGITIMSKKVLDAKDNSHAHSLSNIERVDFRGYTGFYIFYTLLIVVCIFNRSSRSK